MDKANVAPSMGSYRDLTPIKKWCTAVLPCVYDDTLSSYELMCKVIEYVNTMVSNGEVVQDNVQKLYDAFVELQSWVNDNVNEEVFGVFVDAYISSNEDVKESIREVAVPVVKEEVDEYIDSVTEMNVPHLAFMSPTGYVGKPSFRRIVTEDLPSDYPINELTSDNAFRPLSAAMGKALNEGKAPSGYGLGEISGRYCDDPDLIVTPGFYSMGGESITNSKFVGTVFDLFRYGTLLVENRFGYVCQAFKYQGYEANRFSGDGVSWSELEWDNPPMAIGVEYRTMERFNGKPVYKQLINGGGLPSSGGVHLPIPSIGTIDYIISAKGSITSQRVFPSTVIGGSMKVELETTSTGIDVYVSEPWLGGAQFYVTAEYTLV